MILKIAQNLISKGFKVCVVKHDPASKAKFDTPGKDSFLYSQIGANVAVVSPNSTAVFLKNGFFGGEDRKNDEKHYKKDEKFQNEKTKAELKEDLDNLISLFGEFDYLIVEGLKFIPLPRIVLFRDELKEDFLEFGDAFASNLEFSTNKENFKLDDLENIINWIDKNAKKV